MGLRSALSAWWRRLLEKKPLADRGEQAAARHLKRLGYQDHRPPRPLAAGRDRPGGRRRPHGRLRRGQDPRLGRSRASAEAVDAAKQRRLTRLALAYLKRHRLLECPARFDVVAVTWPAGQRRPAIEHFKNAFEATGFKGFHS